MTDNAALDITGGSLTVTSGSVASQRRVDGRLERDAVRLRSGTTFTASGAATINGAISMPAAARWLRFPP